MPTRRSGLDFIGSAPVRKGDPALRANLRKVFSIWTTRVIVQKLMLKPHLSGCLVHVYREKIRTGYHYRYEFRRPVNGGCSCGEKDCCSCGKQNNPLPVTAKFSGKQGSTTTAQEDLPRVRWEQLASEGLIDGLWAAYVEPASTGNPLFHLEQVATSKLSALRQLCPYLGLGSSPQFAYEDFRARRMWFVKATAGCSA